LSIENVILYAYTSIIYIIKGSSGINVDPNSQSESQEHFFTFSKSTGMTIVNIYSISIFPRTVFKD
jgi:hypothetical protein